MVRVVAIYISWKRGIVKKPVRAVVFEPSHGIIEATPVGDTGKYR